MIIGRQIVMGVGLLCASGCRIEPIDDADAQEDVGPAAFRNVPDVLGEVCPAWRQVARVQANFSCTPIGDWTGHKLFGDDIGGEYARYCVYEHETMTPSEADVDTLDDHAKTLEIGADCLAVRPQLDLLDKLHAPLYDLTLDRFGAVTTAELNDTLDDRASVLLSVVDTTPLLDPDDPLSNHGLVMSELAETLSHGCESLTCDVIVRNVLGLARFGFEKDDFDLTHGGYAAFQSELARAVLDSIRSWEGIPAASRPKHIINLSVAWLPEFDGDDMTDVRPGVRAMYLALERASCRDNLVIVSAGNDDAHDCNPTPMLPAHWETLPEPTNARCSSIGAARPAVPPPPVLSPAPTYRPLVHSVGALDFDGLPSGVSRVGGRPRLAALGESIVGENPVHAPWSGTSLSAAGVSGIAALVWSYNDELSSQELAEILWDSGHDVEEGLDGEDTVADYGHAGVLQEIQRVSACDALARACDETGSCPPLALDCASTVTTDALHDAVRALTVVAAESHSFDVAQFANDCPWYCGEELDTWTEVGSAGACIEKEDGDSPTAYLVWPQPPVSGCNACTWLTESAGSTTQSTSVFAQLTTDFANVPVTAASVDLTFDSGAGIFTRNYPLTLGPPTSVELTAESARELKANTGPIGTVLAGKIRLTFATSPRPTVTEDPLTQGTE